MNRRDAIKTLAAVAAGGSLPGAGAVEFDWREHFVPADGDRWKLVHNGATPWPSLSRNEVIAFASNWGFSPVFCDRSGIEYAT